MNDSRSDKLPDAADSRSGRPQPATAGPTDPAATRPAAEPTGQRPPGRHTADLIARIHESADGLARDHTSRGDLKILSRALRELRYAFKVFGPYRSRRKVAMFGSSRTPEGDPCFEQARRFGLAMAEHDWLVVTGAGGGIMAAGHLGAGRENSMGLNIMLPFEQTTNTVVAGDSKLVHMKYFFTRKLMFVKESNAICLLPGGFGTLDEGLEVLTLLQTGKRDMVPVVFLDQPGGTYWRSFHQFIEEHLLRRGMIEPQDLSLLKLTDDVDEAIEEVLGFFRVYHGMRYVRDKLVFRLTRRPSPECVEQINDRFGEILVRGRFRIGGPLSGEKDEPELAKLPRLIFHFNRYDFGRLRQLIDWLNRNVEPRPGNSP